MVEKTEEQVALEQAVARLYAVFDKYTPGVESSPPESWARCLVDRLRCSIKGRGLSADPGETTVRSDSLESYKRSLPKAFEPLDLPADIPELFGELRRVYWREWSEDEQTAILEYFMALWKYELTGAFEDFHDPLMTLNGIANAVDDMSPYLRVWRQTGRAGHLMLAEFIVTGYPGYRVFYDYIEDEMELDPTHHVEQVKAWLLEPETRQTLEEAYHIEPLPVFAEALKTLDRFAAAHASRQEEAL
jgi:hypothetical protein